MRRVRNAFERRPKQEPVAVIKLAPHFQILRADHFIGSLLQRIFIRFLNNCAGVAVETCIVAKKTRSKTLRVPACRIEILEIRICHQNLNIVLYRNLHDLTRKVTAPRRGQGIHFLISLLKLARLIPRIKCSEEEMIDQRDEEQGNGHHHNEN